MSIELIFGVLTIHTYLILFAGTFFYVTALEAANKHRVRPKRLNTLAFLALVTAILSWGAKLTLLKGYFAGEAGYITDVAVSESVSFFSLAQTYVFPVVILFGIMLFLVVWREGHELMEKESVRSTIVILSFTGFGLSAILMFLGVLVP